MDLFGWGYRGRAIDELLGHQRRLNALVVDVRLVPQSRIPTFRRSALARRLPNDYVWVRAFGNINYKAKAGSVHLIEPEAGVREIETAGLSTSRPAILLCACDASGCHRVDVAQLLIEKFGGKFVDLCLGFVRMPGHEGHSEEGKDGPATG